MTPRKLSTTLRVETRVFQLHRDAINRFCREQSEKSDRPFDYHLDIATKPITPIITLRFADGEQAVKVGEHLKTLEGTP